MADLPQGRHGPTLLRRLIEARGITIQAVADAAGLDRFTVMRMLASPRWVAVDSALAIERFSAGEIPASAWTQQALTAPTSAPCDVAPGASIQPASEG